MKHFLTIVILHLAALGFCGEEISLTGSWIGRYEYDKKVDLPNGEVLMILKSESDGKSFSGRHYERNSWGKEFSVTLEANVIGIFDNPITVTFMHKYDGRGGETHSLKYIGTVSSDGKSIVGKWSIGDLWTGTFRFAKVDFSVVK